MYVMIIKNFPNKELVNKFGIYRVCQQTVKGNVWIRASTGILIKVFKAEFIKVEGGKVKLSEIARCIKYLEILKWRIISPNHEPYGQKGGGPALDTYLINEFPWGSVFCYLFRKYKAKAPGGYRACFCPKLPHTHDGWCRCEETVQPQTGQVLDPPVISCILNQQGNHRPIQDIIDELMDIDIATIMKFLKRIKLEQHQLKTLSSLWHFHIWPKISISHIDKVSGKLDFIEGYLH